MLVEKGLRITKEQAKAIQNLGINSVDIKYDDTEIRVVGNNFVDIKSVDLPFDISEIEQLKLNRMLYYPVLKEILASCKTAEELKEALRERAAELSPKHIIVDDIIASVNYIFGLS